MLQCFSVKTVNNKMLVRTRIMSHHEYPPHSGTRFGITGQCLVNPFSFIIRYCCESGPSGEENMSFGSDVPASMMVSMNTSATVMLDPGMEASWSNVSMITIIRLPLYIIIMVREY